MKKDFFLLAIMLLLIFQTAHSQSLFNKNSGPKNNSNLDNSFNAFNWGANYMTYLNDGPNYHSLQYTAGSMFGFGTGYVSFLIVNAENPENDDQTLMALIGGYCLGSTLGVYFYSNHAGHNGSLPATLLGSTLGMGLGALLLKDIDEMGILAILPIMLTFATTTTGSLLGYNLSDKDDDFYWGMLNINKRGIHFGIPTLVVENNQNFFKLNYQTWSANLITAHF